MNGYADFPPSPRDPSKSLLAPEHGRALLQEDTEMSSGCSGNESSENCAPGQGSDRDHGKGLEMLVGPPDAHPGSSAFSLMMAKSEHNPSTSGCSSEQSGKADVRRELVKTLRGLKAHLPMDGKAKGRASTLATLEYALRSVKQVKANEEYYQLLMSSDSHLSSVDVPSYTVEELESVTSEHVAKNVDMFAVGVSLVTGKVLYISNQVASIFHCKRDTFTNAKFVGFLAPQDVSVFHSCTTPHRLPSWGTCCGADSFAQEHVEEKSFFCRVSVGKTPENKAHYRPFRMTPYLVKVREPRRPESQLCCVLLAEKVHSGYEAPRIPPEKRIFTTTHTPNCLFQDVDERAVPLLGYLPQDLLESPVLLQLHPSDRPLMLAIHRKVLRSGGQPFNYSPLRFRVRNGEYITLDTSWSSFVNPWSRKIAFVIGRHKVRVGPLNEDVFADQPAVEEKTVHPSTQELTEQIHRLLLQPVPHSGSSGYSSLGSNGSHEPLRSHTSSSDSNGHEDTCQKKPESCKNGTKAKNKSRSSQGPGEQEKKPVTELQNYPPVPMKAATATAKDGPGIGFPKTALPEELACQAQPAGSYQQASCLDSVIRYLESCSEATTLKRKCDFPASTLAFNPSDKRKATGETASKAAVALPKPAETDSQADVGTHLASRAALPGKAESVVSLSSQCSYSSTIVHVGDKKPQPELEMMEDAASGAESLSGPDGPGLSCSLGPEKEPFKRLGLTKEVLAAHTQKEEQSFLHKFRETHRLRTLRPCCHRSDQERPRGQPSEPTAPGLRQASGVALSWKKSRKNRKLKSKRAKSRPSSRSMVSGGPLPARAPLTGLNATAWSPSNTPHSSCPAVPFRSPTCPLPVFPTPRPVAAAPMAPHTGFAVPVGAQPDLVAQSLPFTAPLAPVMAFVLPSYPLPAAMAPSLPQSFFPSQTSFPGHPEMIPEPMFPSQTPSPTQLYTCPLGEQRQLASRAATPVTPSSTTGPTGRVSPQLFQSRGSSPLQLNLLQLEEAPEGGPAPVGPDAKPVQSRDHPPKARPTLEEPLEAQHSDTLSTSSGLLDLLLSEDLCSASGSALSGSGTSATSESLGSRSLGCTASRSGTGSGDTRHTSQYFGSVDSSEKNHRAKPSAGVGESERLMKYVLQDPIWLLMANTDSSVMMTYQMPARDPKDVLKEDREKLRALRKLQPQFTAAQKQELCEVHPWVQAGGLPVAVDVQECVYCEDKGNVTFYTPSEEDLPTPGAPLEEDVPTRATPSEGGLPALGLSGATDTTEQKGCPLSQEDQGQT